MGNNKVLSLIGNVLDLIIRVVLLVFVIYFLYNAVLRCYDYGYRVFTEEPISKTIGRDITVTVPVDFSVQELGEIFEENGLSRDKYLFMLQYYASEYRKDIKAGVYTFNTTMTAEEMFALMASEEEDEGEELTVLENGAAAGEGTGEGDAGNGDFEDLESEEGAEMPTDGEGAP